MIEDQELKELTCKNMISIQNRMMTVLERIKFDFVPEIEDENNEDEEVDEDEYEYEKSMAVEELLNLNEVYRVISS